MFDAPHAEDRIFKVAEFCHNSSFKTTLETSGEDGPKTTLETSGEDGPKNTLQTSGEDLFKTSLISEKTESTMMGNTDGVISL